jgi:hypothetical protein
MSIDRFKLPFGFDPKRLKQALNQISPGEWTPHFNTGYYEGEWSGVALRSVGGAANALYPDPAAQNAFVDTPMLARCDYIQDVLASFNCETESVRLLKLSAGSRIREHKDHKMSFEDGVIRLHIPIVTDPRVEFFVNNHRLVMSEGECWYVNFNLPHRVYNASDTDRVHLVIDCVVNDWLRSVIPIGEARIENLPAAQSFDVERSKRPGEGLEQFRQLVLEDLSLQEKLIQTPNVNAFLDLTQELGHELGFNFTREDVEDALRKSRSAWLRRWI